MREMCIADVMGIALGNIGSNWDKTRRVHIAITNQNHITHRLSCFRIVIAKSIILSASTYQDWAATQTLPWWSRGKKLTSRKTAQNRIT